MHDDESADVEQRAHVSHQKVRLSSLLSYYMVNHEGRAGKVGVNTVSEVLGNNALGRTRSLYFTATGAPKVKTTGQ